MIRRPKDVLTAMQRKVLSQTARRSTESCRIVQRVNIVLAFAEGIPQQEIAGQLGISVPPVQKWTQRWRKAQPRLRVAEEAIEKAEDRERAIREYRRSVLAVLQDTFRPGKPAEFSAEQVTQIVALACEALDSSEEGVSYRTHKEIATTAEQRGVVQSISSSTVGSFLKSGRNQTA